MTAKRFDVLDYVDTCKALGVNEDLAKFQARQMQELLDIMIHNIAVIKNQKT